jgi:hypothetical protein
VLAGQCVGHKDCAPTMTSQRCATMGHGSQVKFESIAHRRLSFSASVLKRIGIDYP